MYCCTRHQPISVADSGWKVNHIKCLTQKSLQNLRFLYLDLWRGGCSPTPPRVGGLKLHDFKVTATGWTTKLGLRFSPGVRDLSVRQNFQTGNGPCPPSCSVGTGGCCPESEATGAWSWPLLSSAEAKKKKMRAVILPLPHILLWRGAWSRIEITWLLPSREVRACNLVLSLKNINL